MNAAVLVGVLFAIGCAAIPIAMVVGPKLFRPPQRVPGFDTRMSGCPFEPNDVAELLRIFVDEWHKTFGNGEDVEEAIDDLNIYWIRADYIDERGVRALGLTDRPNLVRVCCGKNAPPLSVLVHELVHVALWHLTGEPDPDHAHSIFKGWTREHDLLIERVKMAIA